jgi:hypothetical protein
MKRKGRVKRMPASNEKIRMWERAPAYWTMLSFLDGLTRLVKVLKSQGL